ncbi:MAG: D-2-hydroxyacid dehydrogenase [Anaerolineae bacterium]|nr:D-2-hydroxyacid dehydrogenase [Anaerolineae bacterium]
MPDKRQTLNVLLTLRFTPAQLDKLRAVSPRLHIQQRTVRQGMKVTDVLDPRVHILYTVSTAFPLSMTPDLQWVQLHSAGVEHIMDTDLWRSDRPLTSLNGIHAVPIAEYVIALLLAFAHRVPRMLDYQRRAEWATERWANFVPWEVRGKTLGLVGYGAIGREVARLGQALGMRIVATKRTASDPLYTGWQQRGVGDPDGRLPERFYPPEDLRALLAESDYVVVTTPLTPATERLIGAAELAALKPSAFLVNVGRGAVIDQAALVAALQAGRLAGAGLDVFDVEPLPADSPLWGMDNVILSPHISGFTPRYDDWATDLFAENLRRFLDDEPLINLVDRSRGY